ncbi:hypothetical protein [Rodentibacter pneumotropicus]|uniref:hypothetical protein n=1 Tax=Rodentibacter pneumotropicus TaxID=758 RepID=UPI00109CE33C|nr:hypothetical protein [Rodentibacter pneumotropicus]THA11538.1 hypothetical protein D3M81_08605 [Rodentibacter pneumotropicus]
MLKFLKKTSGKVAVATAGLLASTMALAETQSVDYTSLTSKIDFSTAITAVFCVFFFVFWGFGGWEGGGGGF